MANHDDTLYIPFDTYDEAERLTASFLPEADYRVRIKKVETTKIKSGPNQGTPGIVVWFEVLDGAFAGHFQADRFYVMDSTLWRLAWFLRSVGIKVTKKAMSLPTKQLVGRTLIITTKEGEAYKGNPKSEVSAYNPSAKAAPVETESFSADELPDPWLEESSLDASKADEILSNGVRTEYAATDDPWALDDSISL